MNILDIAIAKKLAGGGGGSGTDNYNDLSNLPKINDTTLSGNKSSSALGLQSEINSDSKLASDLVDDTNQDNKFVTSTEKQTWNAKQNAIDADHKINADYVDDSTSTNKFVTASDKETWNAKQNAIDNSHKLSSDLVDDTNHTNKFVTSTEKQTWNAKQNAIDADHKLSSSLVSFSTAEAAALASGIDSAKVSQISTNQTNILYAVHKVGKNDFNFPVFAKECEVSNGTKVITDESIKLTATSADCFTIPEYNTNIKQYPKEALIPVNSGEKIVFSWVYTPHNSQTNDRVGIFGNGTYDQGKYLTAPAGDGSLEYTVPSDVTYVTVRVGVATSGNSATYSEMMVSKKTAYDADPTYQPFSLPNYDLTRLEAEDRAALAEVVDNGSKNLLDLIYGHPQTYNVTKTDINNTSFTLTATGAYARVYKQVNVATSGDFVLTCSISGLNIVSGSARVRVSSDGAGSYTIAEKTISANGDVILRFNTSLTSFYIHVMVAYSDYDVANTMTVSDVMLCTEDQYKLSNEYVPYGLPNYMITPKCRVSNIATTTTETLYSDCNVNVPAKTIMRITAFLNYSDSIPKSVTLSWSNDTSLYKTPRYVIATAERPSGAENNYTDVQVNAIVVTGNTNATVYPFAASQANGNNRFVVVTEILGTYN